jgi:ergothioneine biosynthesis protein EgtB
MLAREPNHPEAVAANDAVPAVVAPLADRFAAVRAATEALCAGLEAEDCQVQSMPEASPLKWHLAHTTWFFETFVLVAGPTGYRPYRPDYAVMFNSYYQGVGPQHPRPERGLLTRPTLDEIRAYRAHVDGAMSALFAHDTGALAERVELGLAHEQQHQELMLTDVKHAFAKNPLLPSYRPGPLEPDGMAAPSRWIERPAVMVEVGHDGGGFAFDNEQPRHRAWCDAHAIASRPVTNAEYLQFVRDGGYQKPELWLSDGWDRIRAEGWNRPLYWSEDHASVFTLRGLQRLDPHEPVCHVSYYEADAYARWAGARLPREEEWEAAAAAWPVQGNFVESGRLHPRASSARDPEFFGNVWEWTASPYVAYPGFRPAAGAVGEYNGKFMCNQIVLRGGSCASPLAHLRATYRNFFAPYARWQFSGIRLARD